MKVVLFCGGMGSVYGKYAENIPKPLADHWLPADSLARDEYYAHFGHKTSFSAWVIAPIPSRLFSSSMTSTSPMILSCRRAGKNIDLINSDIHDWKITFATPALCSNIGQR